MGCPPEIAEIILKILGTGLLRIRSLAWSGQADRCAVEADHLHNLPDLLSNFSREMLSYYWDVERASYLARIQEADREDWEALWRELRPYVSHTNQSTSIG